MDIREKYTTPELEKFLRDITKRTSVIQNHHEVQEVGKKLFDLMGYDETMYAYNFLWAGIPSIQLPQDLMVKQEIIWDYKPNIIVELGVAWGGGLAFYNSMLILLEICELITQRQVIGIDIEFRAHTLKILQNHPLCKDVQVFEGSSVSSSAFDFVKGKIEEVDTARPLFVLDSFHSMDHVQRELELYAPLVPTGGYIIVEDTAIEFHGKDDHKGARWAPGNSPWTAIQNFIQSDEGNCFDVIGDITAKLIITGMPGGVIKKTR